MQLTTYVLALSAAFIPSTTAAPADASSAVSSDLVTECTDHRVNIYYYAAQCKKDDGSTIGSAVYLANVITNKNGVLAWQKDGRYDRTCINCAVTGSGGTFTCDCETADSIANNPKRTTSTIDLSENIVVQDGHLRSTLLGTPSPNPPDAALPPPANFVWSFQGTTTDLACSRGESKLRCPMTCNDNPSLTDNHWIGQVPMPCWTVPGGIFDHPDVYFKAMKLVTPNGWGVKAFADSTCTQQIAEVKAEDLNHCKDFPDWAKAITIYPLFNVDMGLGA